MANDLFSNTGLFVPSTNVWEIDLLQSTDVNSPAFKELLIRLYQNINAITIALNLKDSAYYVENEFLNGQVFFSDKQAYRTLVDFGALPNNGAKSVAHGITDIGETYSFTRIYACSSDQINLQYIPIPYASASGNDDIQLDVDATNVTITTASDRTDYTVTYVILEYIKY